MCPQLRKITIEEVLHSRDSIIKPNRLVSRAYPQDAHHTTPPSQKTLLSRPIRTRRSQHVIPLGQPNLRHAKMQDLACYLHLHTTRPALTHARGKQKATNQPLRSHYLAPGLPACKFICTSYSSAWWASTGPGFTHVCACVHESRYQDINASVWLDTRTTP